METVFPSDKGYDGFFMVGFRKDPNNVTRTQRTGTVVLKRTYDIDPVTGTLTPTAVALPVFMQDQPDNLLLNSDFESELLDDEGKPIDWHPEGVTIVQTIDPDDSDNHFLQVSGVANGRVVQTLMFEEPLGGRRFVFSFSAKANATPARIEDVQLEADGHVICVISRNLGTTMSRFSASGTWPTNLQATEMRVVLRMATEATRTIWYDKVQVEKRSYLTRWDPVTTLRYEHDLVPFKQQGDVIVLGFTDVAGISRGRVNNTIWFEDNVTLSGGRQKAMFAWEPRVNDEHKERRQEKAGGFSTSGDDYPLEWPFTDPVRDPLPGGPGDPRTPAFDNIFYNGYWRTAAQLSAIPYLPIAADIRIERVADSDYSFTLRGDTAAATYYYHNGTGPDEEGNWQSRAVSMNPDTLVIEPDENRCYVVWRGVWPFDDHSEDAYRRLVVEASA